MKIAVTTTGIDLDAPMEDHFNHAPKFLIYHSDTGAFIIKENDQDETTLGAEIQSALHLTKELVDCVITGRCGPKAYETLSEAGITVYKCEEGTVRDAIERLRRGELSQEENVNTNRN